MRVKTIFGIFAVFQLVLLSACGDLSGSTSTLVPNKGETVAIANLDPATATPEGKVSPTPILVPTLAATTSLPIGLATSPTASSTRVVIATPGLIIAPTPSPEKTSPSVPNTASVTAPATPARPTAATTTSLAVSAASPLPDSEEMAFINQLNGYRQANGRNPLTFDPRLFNSARWMAEDMATKNYISHTDSLSRSIVPRIKSFGYPGPIIGENIAGGLEKAAANLAIWQSDDIHKNNLLGVSYTRVGAGRYYYKASLNGWYWVLDLG